MHFISENYTLIEAVLMLLTDSVIITAGVAAFAITMILTVQLMYNKPEPTFSKIWWVSPSIGFVSSIIISLIFAFAGATLIDLDKGYYEATGTIEKVGYHSEYAGQTNGDYTISLKLDNGDPVDIQIPLQSPELIEPGDDFTLQSDTLFSPHEVEDFTPIEKLVYSPSRQSLKGGEYPIPRFTVDFIVDGVVMKGHSD